MPDYSTLLLPSSQSPSTNTRESIRRRSGAHHSPAVSTGSRQTFGRYTPDVPQDATAGAGHSNGYATAFSPSGISHLTAIPTPSRRSSIIPSRPGSMSRPTTSTMSKIDDDTTLFVVPLNANDDTTTASVVFQATPPTAGLVLPYLSRISVNIQATAKQLSSVARSSLIGFHRKFVSLPNARLPIFNSNKPPSPKSRFGLNRVLTDASATSSLSAADKLTQKWPQPRSSRSMPPGLRLRIGPFSTRPLPGRLRELKGTGSWSQDNMEAILRDSRGLGINWVGQWTLHKWCLLASVTTVFLLGLTCLVLSLLTWFAGESARAIFFYTAVIDAHASPAYPMAPVLLITDSPALILLTFSSSLLLFSSMVGVTGTLLNSRPILAVYVLLLFPAFLSFVSVGYVTYKKATFSLDAKVSEAWNLWFSPGARTVLQGALGCCGWSPLHGAVASGTCYARSPLPGCHGPLLRFERDALSAVAGAVFSLVPLHLVNIFVGLLCANHVTHRFGKGITPALYRLTTQDILSAEGSGSTSSSYIKQSIKRTELPIPPFPAPSGHSAFREDRRRNGTMYKHAHGKF
jgi:hypothetical protein